MRKTGSLCPSSGCYGNGYYEFGGMCAKCWAKLSQDKRNVIITAMGKPPTDAASELPKARIIFDPGPGWLGNLFWAMVSGVFAVAGYCLAHWLFR